MKIYFLPSYPERAPSTRMRVYKIANAFRQLGQSCSIIEHDWSTSVKHGILHDIKKNDILYVQKWRNEFNSAEHVGAYRGQCKIVFDMDDHTKDVQALDLIRIADRLVVGNHYLYDLYREQEPILAPTAVDMGEYPKWQREDGIQIVMAKCGAHSMLRRLQEMQSIFREIGQRYQYRFVLAGLKDSTDTKKVRSIFNFTTCKCIKLKSYVEYLQETVPILQNAMVGILPFIKKDQGKSGHSALANLAMGIPTITTPYAECDHIINDGINGFIVNGDPLHSEEWKEKVTRLLDDADLRQRFREKGWKTIEEHYDVPIIAANLLRDLRNL